MKRNLSLVLLLATSMLFVGCNDSSDPEPTGPTSTSLSANISGTWSGQATLFGSLTNITVSVSQPTSGSALMAVSLTGSLSLNNGTPLAMTGTKDGNDWNLSGNNGSTIASIHQTLTSASTSKGDFTLQVGPPSNKGTVNLNLKKS